MANDMQLENLVGMRGDTSDRDLFPNLAGIAASP